MTRTLVLAGLAVVLSALSQPSDGQDLSSGRGCYAFTWSDTLKDRGLPIRVRLDPQRDTLMPHPPFDLLYFVSGPSSSSDSTALYVHLSHTWWTPLSRDSLHFSVVDRYNVQWDMDLTQHGDSLFGEAQGMNGDAAFGPYSVVARRSTCHPASRKRAPN